MMLDTFTLVTSTASICIFDPEALAHRQNDPADWWADFTAEIDEINAGNVMIVGLSADGTYETVVGISDDVPANSVNALIRNSSGYVFVGPGEEITGGGFQPSGLGFRNGIVVRLEPSTYRVTVSKVRPQQLVVLFSRVDRSPSNAITEQIILSD